MNQYNGKIVRLRDRFGHVFTGIADVFSAEYAEHEYGRKEEGIRVNDLPVFAGDTKECRILESYAILRAKETWQQAGAYYVRIQAMAKKHHITLRQEFDQHDGPDTRYIVVTDGDFPVATARMYELDRESVMIGRVVVLEDYRKMGIGTLVVHACEIWAFELHYARAVVDSRDNKIPFYEKMGYKLCGEVVEGENFRCSRMEKPL